MSRYQASGPQKATPNCSHCMSASCILDAFDSLIMTIVFVNTLLICSNVFLSIFIHLDYEALNFFGTGYIINVSGKVAFTLGGLVVLDTDHIIVISLV